MELGSSSYEGQVRTWSWFQRYYDPGDTNYTPPAFDAATGTLEGGEVLEVALWQSLDPDPYGRSPAATPFTPDMHLESTIPELGREITSIAPVTNKSLACSHYLPGGRVEVVTPVVYDKASPLSPLNNRIC